jgi:hypothetical protein
MFKILPFFWPKCYGSTVKRGQKNEFFKKWPKTAFLGPQKHPFFTFFSLFFAFFSTLNVMDLLYFLKKKYEKKANFFA